MREAIVTSSLPENWASVDPVEYLKDIARALLPEGAKQLIKANLRKAAGKQEVIPGQTVTKSVGGIETVFAINNRSDVSRIMDDTESEYGDALIQAVKTSDCPVVLDVGCAQGIYAIPAALAGARVHAFDPDPVSKTAFERNLGLNPKAGERVRFHHQALGKYEGTINLYMDPNGEYAPSQVKTVKGLGTRIEVPVLKLDYLVSDGSIPAPQIVKIDVEGAEKLVLDGMNGLLKSEVRPNDIFIEIHTGYLPKFGSTAAEVVAGIENSGYQLSPGHFWKRRRELLCHFRKS